MHGLRNLLLFHALTCLGQNALGGEIIDGKQAQENSMLYMASLQNRKGQHVCGGFLISEHLVVTAAHCGKSEPTHVVLGSHNLKRVNNEKIRLIEQSYKPNFESEGQGNDIMILKLSAGVPLDNLVKTIPLPPAGTHVQDNQMCSVAGWGVDKPGGHIVHELRVVDVSVINMETCNKEWEGIPANVICAGGYQTRKGFCQGDSGGPLICNGVAVGIVSYNNNNNCIYPDVPNVYTDVSKYIDWIKGIRDGMKSSE